jgi:hypothetical protein
MPYSGWQPGAESFWHGLPHTDHVILRVTLASGDWIKVSEWEGQDELVLL